MAYGISPRAYRKPMVSMMNTQNAQFDLVMDLEARHDELMFKINELDRRVEQVLAQYLGSRTAATANAIPGIKQRQDP
jgi:hypothetical protein